MKISTKITVRRSKESYPRGPFPWDETYGGVQLAPRLLRLSLLKAGVSPPMESHFFLLHPQTRVPEQEPFLLNTERAVLKRHSFCCFAYLVFHLPFPGIYHTGQLSSAGTKMAWVLSDITSTSHRFEDIPQAPHASGVKLTELNTSHDPPSPKPMPPNPPPSPA